MTPTQLRVSNSIFVQHSYFSKTIPLLKNEIMNLEKINKTYQIQDSLRVEEIKVYKQKVLKDKKTITKFKLLGISGTLVGLLLGLCL